MTVRVVLLGANVMIAHNGKQYRAGTLNIEKGEVLLDVEGNDWTFSPDDLREIADAADRFKAFAATWKQKATPA